MASDAQKWLAVMLIKSELSDVELMQAFLAAMAVRSPNTRVKVSFGPQPRARRGRP